MLMIRQQYASLKDTEVVTDGDLVEDLDTGKREPVNNGFYKFLVGHTAKQAKSLPNIYDVVRSAEIYE